MENGYLSSYHEINEKVGDSIFEEIRYSAPVSFKVLIIIFLSKRIYLKNSLSFCINLKYYKGNM